MTAPDFRKRCDLPATEEPAAIFHAWMELNSAAQEEGMKWVRMTVVNDEFPEGDTPHGMYLEGWLTQPAQQPPFSWPADA